jgi:hypothetical protein
MINSRLDKHVWKSGNTSNLHWKAWLESMAGKHTLFEIKPNIKVYITNHKFLMVR